MKSSFTRAYNSFFSRYNRLYAKSLSTLGFPRERIKIYDCFIFYDELDLLELRLSELYCHVDWFVLVESRWTFRGDKKPLYFEDNKIRFQRFLSKIRHVVVDFVPEDELVYNPGDSRPSSEAFQRRLIQKGIVDADDQDVLLISDVDEIPNPFNLQKHVNICRLVREVVIFKQDWYILYLNARVIEIDDHATKHHVDDSCHWFGTLACTAKVLRTQFDNDPHRVWAVKWTWSPWIKLSDAGWHFSWMGGYNEILNKLRASPIDPIGFSPDWQNIASYRFNGMRFKFVPIDRSYPSFLSANIDRFQGWVGSAAKMQELAANLKGYSHSLE
jgi:beta-1,4-mannosyl-glycoprotein beta-1,4-N-acetylglucosaminyltransferase